MSLEEIARKSASTKKESRSNIAELDQPLCVRLSLSIPPLLSPFLTLFSNALNLFLFFFFFYPVSRTKRYYLSPSSFTVSILRFIFSFFLFQFSFSVVHRPLALWTWQNFITACRKFLSGFFAPRKQCRFSSILIITLIVMYLYTFNILNNADYLLLGSHLLHYQSSS